MIKMHLYSEFSIPVCYNVAYDTLREALRQTELRSFKFQ